jgi:F-type H+-transporting ATPase subunit epsilon
MPKSFQVNIVTPEKTAFEETAISIILPGTEGYLGAWANHAPLVTGVRPGVVWLKLNEAGDQRYFAVGAGFCEMSENKVNLMVDAADVATEIDLGAAEKELTSARQALKALAPADDADTARASLERAEARVKAVRRSTQR